MRNKLLIGFIFFAVLVTQFSCSQIRQLDSQIRQAELERNRSLWRESKIENYIMTIKIQKTGHATPKGTFIIIVRGGIAKSIKSVDFNPDDELVKADIKFGGYSTIEGVFNFIESAEKDKRENNSSWDRREIEYDAKFGYPKKVDLDQSGVFDDELYFEVLEFEFEDSSGGKPTEKSSLPKSNSVSATEITKVEFSSNSGSGWTVESDGSITTWSKESFSSDGTAHKSIGADHDDKGKEINTEVKTYQGIFSKEQFQKLAQTLADNDFSNLEDLTEHIAGAGNNVLTISYLGKTKTIVLSSIGNDTAEIKEILDAFEALRDKVGWKEIK